MIEPSDEVMLTLPQSSVAVAVPAAGTPLGLQPRSEPEGQNVITGAVTSAVQVNIWSQVVVFPHPSVAM
jgi:hypothetical protein